MKVEQEGTGFAPITITLETKEEADIMWAALNVPWKQMASHNNILNEEDFETRKTAYRMFCVFADLLETI